MYDLNWLPIVEVKISEMAQGKTTI